MFTSSIKRENRDFHVVVVQWRQRNVEKSVMHVQSCCFAYYAFFFFADLVPVAVVVAKASYFNRFEDEGNYKDEIFSILSTARAWTRVILAGKVVAVIILPQVLARMS